MHGNNDSGSHNNSITVRVLRPETRQMLSTLLNPPKLLKTEKGKPRDWQGLAELCKISGEKIPLLHSVTDPTSKILDLWIEKSNDHATVDALLTYLEEIDRFDIIDDITPLVENDKEFYKQNPNGIKPHLSPNLAADSVILTRDDVKRVSQGLGPQFYDAFVLFADDDIDFATQMIDTMENRYNFKFCVKDRDLVGGSFEHDSVITLITERCNRLVVIVSPAFLDSTVNKYLLKFAQAIGIDQSQRKIIPCIYKESGELPAILKYCYKLDFRKSKLYNFWDRLGESIQAPNIKPKAVADVTPVSRKIPTLNSVTSKSMRQPALKPALHTENSIRPINQTVKFSSMFNLTDANQDQILPEENMMSSSSANDIDSNTSSSQHNTSTMKKNNSFYKKLKNIMVKHKSHEKEINGKVVQEKSEKEKEKKKFWTRSKEKKKMLAVAT